MAKDKDDKEDSATKWHNKGEQDQRKNNYDPPRGWVAETTVASDKDRANCESYREGWRNAKKQG